MTSRHEAPYLRFSCLSQSIRNTFLLSATLLASAHANAQSTSASAAQASAQPSTLESATPSGGNTLAEIIVTAQKREERLQDVPISMSVLEGPALDKQPIGGTLEELTEVPAVSESSSDAGGMTSVSIRGVSPSVTFGDGSSTIGYYIDSIPFGLVRSAAVPNINDYDLSRIEVLRGPQGTLYGASALNGVVRIITNDADPSHFDAKVRVGGADTDGGGSSYRADAEVNVPIIQDKLAIRVVAGDDHEGGWINQPARGLKDVNTTDNQNARVKVDIRPVDNLKIDLEAWHQREKDNAASYADEFGNQSTTLPEPGTTTINAYNVKVDYGLPFMTVSSATSYLNYGQVQYTDFTYVVPGDRLYSNLPAKAFTEELLLNSRDSDQWRWSAGAFYRNAHDDRYQTLAVVLPGPISWRDLSKSTAVFGQITRTFDDDHFEVSGGLRYFHDDAGTETLLVPGGFLPASYPQARFHAVTPRVVATWLPSRQLTVYASYSEGFRSGLEQTPLTLLAAPLPPAKADTLHNYELGAKGSALGGLITYDTALYYIKWDDIQEGGDLLYNGVYISATINGRSASGVGTDVSVTLHPMQGLAFGVQLSDNQLKFDEDLLQGSTVLYPKGSRLPFSPEYTAAAFGTYAFSLTERLDSAVEISGSYRSKEIEIIEGGGTQLTNGNSDYASGAPLIVNASFAVSNQSGQTLSLYVHNMTNWNGLLIPSPEPTTPFRTRPLTVGLQFETKFE